MLEKTIGAPAAGAGGSHYTLSPPLSPLDACFSFAAEMVELSVKNLVMQLWAGHTVIQCSYQVLMRHYPKVELPLLRCAEMKQLVCYCNQEINN